MKIAPLTYTMGGAISICRLDKECGHVAGHDAGHRIVRIARPVLDLEAATLLLDELVLLGDESVIHTLELLVAPGTSTVDISTAGSTQLDKRSWANPDDMDSRHAALSLSYHWLGKLHEKNKQFSPASCYKRSKREARTIAIEGDDYIERVIDFLPVP